MNYMFLKGQGVFHPHSNRYGVLQGYKSDTQVSDNHCPECGQRMEMTTGKLIATDKGDAVYSDYMDEEVNLFWTCPSAHPGKYNHFREHGTCDIKSNRMTSPLNLPRPTSGWGIIDADNRDVALVLFRTGVEEIPTSQLTVATEVKPKNERQLEAA